MGTRRNELWPADKELFASMKTNSISHEEFIFFQNMQVKQENEATLSNDLILSENDNKDKVYIVRVNFDEYIVGCALCLENEVHVMNLTEALNVNLSEIGIKDDRRCLWDWLRAINYKGISYNHNFDNM